MASIFTSASQKKFWVRMPLWSSKSPSSRIFSGKLVTVTEGKEEIYTYDLYPFQLYQKVIENNMSKFTDLNFRSLKPFIEIIGPEKRFGFSIDSQDFYVASKHELDIWLKHLKPMCILSSFDEDFVMIKEIGKGSTSTVYLSEHIETRKQYAIKCIDKKTLRESSSGINNLKDEISILNSFDHQGIIKLFYVYESEEIVYLVTEYLFQGNLCNVVKYDKKLKVEVARNYIRSLLETLHYIHSNGIIHRDLKLENLMIYGNNQVKIIDFGLSYCSSAESNSKCGSPGYIAPEVLICDHYDSKIDIFSTGVILYVLLTGKHPFDARDDWKVLERNMKVKYKLDKDIPVEAQDIIRSMLQFDPDLRPTAQQLLECSWLYDENQLKIDQGTNFSLE